MAGNQQLPTVISFGPFQADLLTQELKKQGVRLRVPGQSFQILKLLLDRPGELVSREELHTALWPSETFVDFEHGVNAAVNRLRETLADSADSPHLIETLPRRGYRFIGNIDVFPKAKDEAENHGNRLKVAVWIVGVTTCALVIGFIYLKFQPATKLEDKFNSLVAVPFTTLKGREVMPALGHERGPREH